MGRQRLLLLSLQNDTKFTTLFRFYNINLMITTIISLIICAIIQGAFKSCSDALMSGRFQTKFNIKNQESFFGSNSWVRKYKNGKSSDGEAFKGSTSIFVWLTDAWHLSNTFGMIANVAALIIAFQMSLTLIYAIGCAVIYWFLRSGTHHVVYTYFFRNRA